MLLSTYARLSPCYTTMSTLRHKHGCNQEFYNMHVLSYCTNKKKVTCHVTPQRQISVSTCFTTYVRQCLTPETRPAITVFTRKQEEVFSLQFGSQICEVILNMCITRRTTLCKTGSLWTRSCRAKPWPALTNHCVRSLFFEILCSVSGNSLQIFQ